MKVTFDPEKSARNRTKHGLDLSRASELVILRVLDDRFDYGETRYRAYGLLDWLPHCLVFTVTTDGVRAISLRPAHMKEIRRHVPE